MDNMLSRSTILFDVCSSKITCRYLTFPEYFLLADRMFDVLVTHVTRLRGGFGGAIFQFEPGYDYDHDWGSWEQLLAMRMKSVPVENHDFWLGSTLHWGYLPVDPISHLNPAVLAMQSQFFQRIVQSERSSWEPLHLVALNTAAHTTGL